MQFLLNQLCLKCRVKLCFQTVKLYRSTSTTENGVIMDTLRQLGFAELEAIQIAKNKQLQNVEIPKMKRIVERVKKLGFPPGEIVKYPRVLKLSSTSIDHYYKILEECGVSVDNIKLEFITRTKFMKLIKMPTSELKKKGLIEKGIDVKINILRYTDLPSSIRVPETDDSQCLGITQTDAVKHYLCWRLDLKREEVDNMYRSYNFLHYKSIRLVCQCYDIVTNNIGMSVEKVRRNGYLLHGHPDNYLDMLDRVPTLGKEPIRPVIVGIPKILHSTTDTVLEILQILKEYDLPEEELVLHPRVLTLSAATVRERLSHLHSDPSFRPYIHNRRRLKMVIYFHCAYNRKKILSENKWRCSTLDLLSTGKKEFDKRCKIGLDFTTGFDTVNMLNKELNLTKAEIRATLNQHSHWNHIPVMTVFTTLEYLRQAGIQRSQIIGCLQVLLYPTKDVEKYLQLIETSPEVDCCRNSNGKVRPELVLHLVMYFLERPYHFTGNGIWGDTSPGDLLSQ